MKTKLKKSGLQNRNEHPGTQTKTPRLPIDAGQRRRNRALSTPELLGLLVTVPDLYRLAEVVGKWVWVQFQEIPAPELRQQLAQLGFHWNRGRQTWQHPCGTITERADYDPRQRYGSYFAADRNPA